MIRQYIRPDGQDFDFTTWRNVQEQNRAERRAELTRHLAAGITVLEVWNGRLTDWVIMDHHDQPISRVETYHHESGNRHQQFVTGSYSPAQLAAHLESRAYGFGASLEVYCSHCGENTTPLDDAINADYIDLCADCDGKFRRLLATSADEDRIEDGQARWAETGSTRK